MSYEIGAMRRVNRVRVMFRMTSRAGSRATESSRRPMSRSPCLRDDSEKQCNGREGAISHHKYMMAGSTFSEEACRGGHMPTIRSRDQRISVQSNSLRPRTLFLNVIKQRSHFSPRRRTAEGSCKSRALSGPTGGCITVYIMGRSKRE